MESALCSNFTDPTKTCGSHLDHKTLVYNEVEAWMTDGEKTAHLVEDRVVSSDPPDTEIPQEWIKVMTDAVSSMQGKDRLYREVHTPRYPHVDPSNYLQRSNFRYAENTQPTAMDHLFRIGDREVKTTVPGDGYVHVDTVRDLTYTDTGFQVKEAPTWIGTILQTIGL
jgi:hypothetical protein